MSDNNIIIICIIFNTWKKLTSNKINNEKMMNNLTTIKMNCLKLWIQHTHTHT